jgi:hypothetical protein
MFENAYLSIDRATECITQLNELFREHRPFSYVLETNTETGQRATFAKKNKPIIDRAAIIARDAVHTLRVALDYTYWEITSPFAKTAKEKRAVQFPFCERANGLNEAVKNRLANRVSQRFFDAIIGLKPYGEPGGNTLLYLIHSMDVPNKHRFPPPTGDYTRISSEIIRWQVPDFPSGLVDNCFGQNHRDVVWYNRHVDPSELGIAQPPTTNIFEKELDVPVDIIFVVTEPDYRGPVIPTINEFVDVTKKTIAIMKSAI